jgi:DNA polymerase III subunit epsilon
MLREIVLDTETTGLDARKGDRLIELGCIELVNRRPTGREFHTYLNPDGRSVHPRAEAVHGIASAFLEDKPTFGAIVDEFLGFIDGAPLVIHNAGLDMGFINMELDRAGRPPIPMDRVINTLTLARRKHAGGPNSLDALCERYGIDTSARTKHGALTDASLLAKVYVELLGQPEDRKGRAKQGRSKAALAHMAADEGGFDEEDIERRARRARRETRPTWPEPPVTLSAQSRSNVAPPVVETRFEEAAPRLPPPSVCAAQPAASPVPCEAPPRSGRSASRLVLSVAALFGTAAVLAWLVLIH